jgi:hypothetical protein
MKNHHNGMSIQLLRLNRLDDTPSDSKISVTVPFLLLINPYLHKVATLTLDRREYIIWFHYIQVLNRQKHILLETLKKLLATASMLHILQHFFIIWPTGPPHIADKDTYIGGTIF